MDTRDPSGFYFNGVFLGSLQLFSTSTSVAPPAVHVRAPVSHQSYLNSAPRDQAAPSTQISRLYQGRLGWNRGEGSTEVFV